MIYYWLVILSFVSAESDKVIVDVIQVPSLQSCQSIAGSLFVTTGKNVQTFCLQDERPKENFK